MLSVAVLSVDSPLMITVVNSKNFSNTNDLTSSKIFKFPSLILSALMSDWLRDGIFGYVCGLGPSSNQAL